MYDNQSAVKPIPARSCDSGRATMIGVLRDFCIATERWTRRSPLIASVTWMGLLFAIALAVHVPAHETNDDVVMSMIASGTGAGAEPDEHLVFTSFAIGLVLKQLYILLPSIPWYGLYLIGALYLSNVAVLYSLLKWRYSRAAVFCFVLLFGIAGVQLMDRLQFTSTAVWTTECGIFLVLNALAIRRDSPVPGSLRMLGAGMALMVLGSLIRFDSYVAAVAISAIPIAILIWQLDRSVTSAFRIWRQGLAVALLTQCLVFGMHAAHKYYYSLDPAWKEYLVFNPYRVKFNDYCWTHYSPETKPVFDSVQWSENDHQMIRMCYFDDSRIFGRPKLQAIIDNFPWAQEAVSLQKMMHWWHEIMANVRLWPIWALLPLQALLARDRWFAIRHFFILTFSLDAILCGLMFLKNPPMRVYYSLIAFQVLYTLFLMRYHAGPAGSQSGTATDGPADFDIVPTHRGSLFPNFTSVFIVAFAILGFFVGEQKALQDSRKAVRANRRLRNDLATISPRESDLIVCWGCCFPYEAILPLESTRILKSVNLLCLGWTQQSPVNDAVKKQFGIQDLSMSLFDNPHVYLLSQGSELESYRTYIREHYQVESDWESCYEGTDFKLFKPAKRIAVRDDSRQSSVARSPEADESKR